MSEIIDNIIHQEDIGADMAIQDQIDAQNAGIELQETTEAQKSAKVVKRKKKTSNSYGTRFQWVGEIYCLFLSFYKKGRFPICSIGPSWGFTIGLLFFAGMCGGFMGFMISQISDAHLTLKYIAIFSIVINLYLLFGGICGDPGIKKETYLHYTKKWNSGDKELYTHNSEEEDNTTDITYDDDLESSAQTSTEEKSLKRRNQRKDSLKKAEQVNIQSYRPNYETRIGKDGNPMKVLYCIKCNIDVTNDMEHCDECDVCVYDYDHHCVFFSKCIGGGNIYCFGGSIGMLIFNFIIIFIILIIDVDSQQLNKRSIEHKYGSSRHNKYRNKGVNNVPQLAEDESKNDENKEIGTIEENPSLKNDTLNLQKLSISSLMNELNPDLKVVSDSEEANQNVIEADEIMNDVDKVTEDFMAKMKNDYDTQKVDKDDEQTYPDDKPQPPSEDDIKENEIKTQEIEPEPKELTINQKVDEMIKDNKIMVFSKSWCGFSKKTKALLKSLNLEFEVYEIDKDPQGEQVHNIIKTLTKQRTVPNIFINGQHLGGNDTLQEANKSGELQKMLDGKT